MTDALSLLSGDGVNVTGSSAADSVTFSANLVSDGGLMFAGGALTLLNTCSNTQFLAWNSGGSSWTCTSPTGQANLFSTIGGDSGSAIADTSSDTLTIAGGNGINTVAADSPDSVTLDVDLAAGGGLAFASGALRLSACSDGQILKVSGSSWACAADNSTPTGSYRQHLAGADNITIGSSMTPLLTNGSGTALNLPITINSGSEVSYFSTIEISSSLATGPVTFVVIRDDNNDNDCQTGGGDGTQVGAQTTTLISSVAQSFTTTISFADTSPGTTAPRYQLCASTTIATGTTTASDRSLKLEEVNY